MRYILRAYSRVYIKLILLGWLPCSGTDIKYGHDDEIHKQLNNAITKKLNELQTLKLWEKLRFVIGYNKSGKSGIIQYNLYWKYTLKFVGDYIIQ